MRWVEVLFGPRRCAVVLALTFAVTTGARAQPERDDEDELAPAETVEELQERYEWIQKTLNLSVSDPSMNGEVSKWFPEGPLPKDHLIFTPGFQRELDAETHTRLTAGNQLELLPNGASGARKLALMKKAKETLFVSALILHCDPGGKRFTNAMIAAARRGVDTRLVLDGVGAWAGVGCVGPMRDAGVKVVVSQRSLNPVSVDWEMHDKLFIVDATEAIVGGQNLGSWYFESNGVDDNYRDTDVWVRGPAVRQIARRFARIWREQRPSDSSLESYLARLHDLEARDAHRGLVGRFHYPSWLQEKNRRGLCRFVGQDPHRGTHHVFRAYTLLARASRTHVVLHALSLEPVGSALQEALRDALIGVAQREAGRVDILTNGPGVSSSKALPPQLGMWWGALWLSNAWEGIQGTPLRVWAYRSYLHSKAYYFDGAAIAIGSFNFDASGTRCQESTLICIDPDLAADAREMFAKDLANAIEVSIPAAERVRESDVVTPPTGARSRPPAD